MLLFRMISDCNGIRIHNHLVRKRTLNHLTKLMLNKTSAHLYRFWAIILTQERAPRKTVTNSKSIIETLQS